MSRVSNSPGPLMKATVAIGFLLGGGAVRADEGGKPLNVVLILVDDLGWTDLGCFGSDFYETPAIDRLAAEGMRFTSAYSACTVCSPTRAAVMTGKYPARLHLTDWIHGHKRPKAKLKIPEWTEYLSPDEFTLPRAFQAAGYATASIGKWHLGDGEEHDPTHYGFDLNRGGFGAGQPPSYFSPYRIPTLADGPNGEYLTDREADEACKFIESQRERPFFLYWPHYAVHTPLEAKPELVEHYRQKVKPAGRHANATYAAMIASLDESVARLQAKLVELGLAERIVIAFTSDNGGLLGAPQRPITSNAPLRAGKGSAYEGGVRVPLIVKWPGVTKPGAVCETPVMSIDLLPTLLEIAGVKSERTENIDGRSFAASLRDPRAKLDREALFWHYPHYHPGGATPYGAVRAGDFRVVEFYEDDHVELYNLRDDLREQRDLAQADPQQTARLRQMLGDWRKRVGAQMPTPNPHYQAP
ncbi:MAG TPA: sulfatase [Pirellulales bacterium]|nr:sulfatase [Pirellulales bacterium]